MKGKWKPDGPKTRKAPADFVKRKRKQFLTNIFQSLILGNILALALQAFAKIFVFGTQYNLEIFILDLYSCAIYSGGGLVLTLVLSLLS